jgi:CheY-like chemotaxis protein
MKRIGTADPVASALPSREGSEDADEILYVEDDDDNYLVAELRIGKRYRLVRARDAEETCRVVRSRGEHLRAILMDIELRGSDLNGIELAQLVRGMLGESRLPDYAVALPKLSVPVLFVTAHGAKYDEPRLRAMGGDRLITKPVDFGELELALAQLRSAESGGSGA